MRERRGSGYDWLEDMKAWVYVCVYFLLLLHLQGSSPGPGDLRLGRSTWGFHPALCPAAGPPAADCSPTLQGSQRTGNLDQLQPSLLDWVPNVSLEKDNKITVLV